MPGSAEDVYFSASNAVNFTTTLQNFNIKGLFFTGANAVTIGGAANTLTIGTDGLTVQAGAGAPTISANVAIGGNQTWSLNDAPSLPLTISGTLTAAHNLTLSGTGELYLSGTNSFSGTTTISGTTVLELGNANALNSTSTAALAFGASSSGTFDLNGFNASIGSLSSSGGSPVIQNASATAVTLTGSQTTSGIYSGVIQDGLGGGSLGFTMNGPAALTLAGNNTYSGSTIVNAGLLAISGTIGSGNVAVNNTGTLGGSGKITGAVTVNHGGEIMPGTSHSGRPYPHQRLDDHRHLRGDRRHPCVQYCSKWKLERRNIHYKRRFHAQQRGCC